MSIAAPRRRSLLGSPTTPTMLLLNGAGIGLAAALALHRGGVTPSHAALLVLFGANLWTLVEYVVHRALLHGVMARSHARHHKQPADPRFLHGPLSAWGVTYAVSLAGLTLSLGLAPGLWAFVGLNAAYVAFELTHAAIHADFSARWFRPARLLHAAHHHDRVTRAYGFCTPYWDWVFGTLGPRRRFPRLALWMLPLPVPMVHFVLASLLTPPRDEPVAEADLRA